MHGTFRLVHRMIIFILYSGIAWMRIRAAWTFSDGTVLSENAKSMEVKLK